MLSFKYPNEDDQLAVEEFIGNEILLAGILLSAGDTKNAVEHLANTVLFTGHNERLLYTLLTTLPDKIFRMTIETLPETREVRSFASPALWRRRFSIYFFVILKENWQLARGKNSNNNKNNRNNSFYWFSWQHPFQFRCQRTREYDRRDKRGAPGRQWLAIVDGKTSRPLKL